MIAQFSFLKVYFHGFLNIMFFGIVFTKIILIRFCVLKVGEKLQEVDLTCWKLSILIEFS